MLKFIIFDINLNARNLTLTNKILIRACKVLVFLSITINLSSQDLKVGDFKSLPLDVSARTNPVFDANGDACAIIKVRTGLDSLRFSGDLKIRKIEKHEGEFWLRVSTYLQKITILSKLTDNIGHIL